jgi:hypothetical protein
VLVFLLVGGLDSWRRYKQIRHGGPRTQAYYKVSPVNRLLVASVYIALAALLVAGMNATYVHRAL